MTTDIPTRRTQHAWKTKHPTQWMHQGFAVALSTVASSSSSSSSSSSASFVFFSLEEYDETRMLTALLELAIHEKENNGAEHAMALFHPGDYLHKVHGPKYKPDFPTLASKSPYLQFLVYYLSIHVYDRHNKYIVYIYIYSYLNMYIYIYIYIYISEFLQSLVLLVLFSRSHSASLKTCSFPFEPQPCSGCSDVSWNKIRLDYICI